MTIALIDADGIRYAAAHVADKTSYQLYAKGNTDFNELNIIEELQYHKDLKKFVKKEFGKELSDFTVNKVVNPMSAAQACNILDTMITGIFKNTGATEAKFFLSPSKNFRHDIAITKEYKGSRKTEKPTHFGIVGEHLQKRYGAVVQDNIEADDALAMWSEIYHNEGIPSVIVSEDKDLKTIHGAHYDFKKKESIYIHPETSEYLLYKQILTGDSGDDIPGLPRIGPKTADKILSGITCTKDLKEAVKQAYIDKVGYGWDVYLEEQANLIYIRRDPNVGLHFT